MRLRDVADELGTLAARYGRSFEQCGADWNVGHEAITKRS